MKVAISCGHNCAGDTGASGFVLEDNITWRVGQRLATYLANRSYDAFVCNPVRSTPTVRESLKRRISNANGRSPQIYISIHCNAFRTANAKGTEVYYFGSNQIGKAIATEASKEIASIYKTVNRGAKSNSNFMELRETNCTAILVELAFVTNKDDAAALSNEQLDDKVCDAIFKAVQRVIGRNETEIEEVKLPKVYAPNHLAMEAATFDADEKQPQYDVFWDYETALKEEEENDSSTVEAN